MGGTKAYGLVKRNELERATLQGNAPKVKDHLTLEAVEFALKNAINNHLEKYADATPSEVASRVKSFLVSSRAVDFQEKDLKSGKTTISDETAAFGVKQDKKSKMWIARTR